MQTFETQLRTVTAKDLDELNHVNNVRYVQWVQDMCQSALGAKCITTYTGQLFLGGC